jgi:hypothetical protein
LSTRRRFSFACVLLLAICAAGAAISLGSAGAAGGEPAEDHLVVTDIPFLETAQAVRLERFSGTGVAVGHSWPLPTVASGTNHAFTLQGNSNAVGAVALSGDKRYLSLAGYTTAVGGSAGATEPRDVARVNVVGAVDTSTTLGLSFEKENIRGAVTKDGTSFWVTGNGNGTGTPLGGMIYAPLGNSTTPTVIFSKTVPATSSNKALNNMRSVQLVGGDLYAGSEKGTAGVYKIAGTPTTATAPTNLFAWTEGEDPVSELPLEATPGSGEVNLMYVSKEATGIFKYALESGTWTLKGEVAAGEFGPLTGKVDSEGHFRIYAIKGKEVGNEVVLATDTAAFDAAPTAATPTVVKTAAAGTAFRGLAFAPEDPTLEAEVPGETTGVTGVAGDQKVELSWTVPGSAGASTITEYVITPFVGGVAQAPISTGSTATSHTVEGLANGTAYTFTVAAVNAAGPGPASAASAAVTPATPGAPTPTIALTAEHLEGTNSDPTNPTNEVEVTQGAAPSTALSVEATASTNPAVAAVSGVAITGTGATRIVSVTPAGGVGYADITLKVTGEEGKTAITVLHYAASTAAPNPTSARFYTGAADASTAISVGEGYVLLGDDENNIIRLYKRDTSGAPVKEWNFEAQMGNPEEIDIEAAARSGETIYWTGSMGNSKSGNLKPDRSTLFTTHITGTGANTELSFDGYYKGLRQDLIEWDEAHADRFGFAAGAASGQIPKELNGFNVEGLEFAPGSESTAYIGFRAPLSPATATGDAVVVPVTNINALAASGLNTTTHATFGEPILMNLGGLSIREIRKNSSDEYLIIAGSYQGGGNFALYTWDGVPTDSPVRTLTALQGETGGGEDPGSWESIVEVPHPLVTGSEVQLVMDNGSTDFYGDGAEAKTLAAEWEKDRGETFTVELPVAPANTTAPTVSGQVVVGSTLTCSPGAWTGAPSPSFGYEWLRDGTAINGATGATYVTVAADAGKAIGCKVTGRSSAGSTSATSSNTITPTEPTQSGNGGGSGGNSGGGTKGSGGSGSTGNPTTPRVSTPNSPVAPKGDQATVGTLSCGSTACTVTGSSATLQIGGKSIKVKVKVQGKIGAGRSASVKVMLPKAIKAELAAGKTGTIRAAVKVKNAEGKNVTRTITVRIKAKPKAARALSLLRLGF